MEGGREGWKSEGGMEGSKDGVSDGWRREEGINRGGRER